MKQYYKQLLAPFNLSSKVGFVTAIALSFMALVLTLIFASMSIADSRNLADSVNNWRQIKYNGAWGMDNGTLTIHGEGYRLGNHLEEITARDFRHATIKVKWSVDGGNSKYMGANFYIGTMGGGLRLLRPFIMTTDHSYLGSKVIQDNVVYFSIINIYQDQTFYASTAKGNYEDLGGDVAFSTSGSLETENYNSLENAYFQFGIGDNYGGKAASMALYELFIKNFNTNTPPVAEAGSDVTGYAGESTCVFGGGADADGDELTYIWASESVHRGSNLYP